MKSSQIAQIALSPTDIDNFIIAYIECALWSSTNDAGDPLDDMYCIDDLSPEARLRIKEDCEDFIKSNTADLLAYVAYGRTIAQAGHDYWLTRNRHGAGYWDRGLGEPGERLSNAAKVYGSCNLCVGDNNTLYFQ